MHCTCAMLNNIIVEVLLFFSLYFNYLQLKYNIPIRILILKLLAGFKKQKQ